MKFKILNTIGKKYSNEGKKILSSLGDVDYMELSTEELLNSANKYDVIIAGLYPKITKATIDKADRLKVISSVTTNLDHIDVEYAGFKGIPVLSLKGETEFLSGITSTAELAFGLIIDLVRNVPWAFASVKDYSWDKERFRGHSLSGKTLGIAGLGRLGKMVARYGNAFGMKVIAYDPHIEDKEFENSKCIKASFKMLMKNSDIISVHVPYSKDNINIFGKEAFAEINSGVFLVNTSVRTIVNEKDILEALKSGKIAGYAADVLEDELEFDTSGFYNNPLVEYAKNHDNVIIVPHIGGTTYESREATDIFIAEKLKNFLSNADNRI